MTIQIVLKKIQLLFRRPILFIFKKITHHKIVDRSSLNCRLHLSMSWIKSETSIELHRSLIVDCPILSSCLVSAMEKESFVWMLSVDVFFWFTWKKILALLKNRPRFTQRPNHYTFECKHRIDSKKYTYKFWSHLKLIHRCYSRFVSHQPQSNGLSLVLNQQLHCFFSCDEIENLVNIL